MRMERRPRGWFGWMKLRRLADAAPAKALGAIAARLQPK
jgi:hypothetical protein